VSHGNGIEQQVSASPSRSHRRYSTVVQVLRRPARGCILFEAGRTAPARRKVRVLPMTSAAFGQAPLCQKPPEEAAKTAWGGQGHSTGQAYLIEWHARRALYQTPTHGARPSARARLVSSVLTREV